jgi:carboxyl-terminal processing protease
MKNIQRLFTTRMDSHMIPAPVNRPALFGLLLFTLGFVLAGCTGETNANIAPTSIPRPIPTVETFLTADERVEIFEAAWQTVNDKYFDPTFSGKDWQAIGDEFREKIGLVQDDHTFWFEIMNPMLFELGVSHLLALPGELAVELSRESFTIGTLGMDVRLLDGKPVITQVKKSSPAEKAGLRPGYEITSVDGWTQDDLAAFDLQIPPNNERNRLGRAVNSMRATLSGEVGSAVVIEYLDADEQMRNVTLKHAPRSETACGQIDPSLPEACAEVEVRHLVNEIGYLRFSGFLMPVLDNILQAIKDLHEAPALIIDLRGNPGGQFPVRKAIASQLVGEAELFASYKQREGIELAYLEPVPDAFSGEVVILVDELSTSSSEEFAGSLQALGRATVIGTQTPGSCLTMNVEPLPKGAILMYPFGQSRTPNGRILEDNGVVPDIEVVLEREQLIQGIDAQLEAAIEYAAKQVGN